MTHPPSAFLVADIGGTNARFAVAESSASGYVLHSVGRLAASDFPALEDAVGAYLASTSVHPKYACFAVAGPVTNNSADLTNSPWMVDGAALARQFGLSKAHVVNDFIGQARGAVLVPDHDMVPILEGAAEPDAPIAILGPGTGLGLAYLHRAQGRLFALATEGGHTAFAPITEREMAVASALTQTLGYVSFESIASGIGIRQVWQALHTIDGAVSLDLDAGEISARAATDVRAAEALDMFFSALGVFAGNAVLMGGARGGVRLGGGILPKMQTALRESAFETRFRNRGPMSAYLAHTPVHLILSADTALYGAAAIAADDL